MSPVAHTHAAVLVTGATSGIDQAICERFGHVGHHVFAHARDAERGKRLVDRLLEQDYSVELLPADLRDEEAPATLTDQVQQTSYRLDTVVNNAGGVLENGFAPGKVEDPLESYQVNVFAAYGSPCSPPSARASSP